MSNQLVGPGILAVFSRVIAISNIRFLAAALAISLFGFSGQSYATVEYYSQSYIDNNGLFEEKTYSKSNSRIVNADANGAATAYSSVDINSSGNLEAHAYVSTTNNNSFLKFTEAKTKSIYAEELHFENLACDAAAFCTSSIHVDLHQTGLFSLTSSTGTQLTYEFRGGTFGYFFTLVFPINGSSLADVAPRAKLTDLYSGEESAIKVTVKDNSDGTGSFEYDVDFDVAYAVNYKEYLLVSAQTYGVVGTSFLDTANSFHAHLTPSEGSLVGESGRTIKSAMSDNSVPEPGSLALLGFGFASLGMIRRRKSKL